MTENRHAAKRGDSNERQGACGAENTGRDGAARKAEASAPGNRDLEAPNGRDMEALYGRDAGAPRGQSAPKRGRIGRLLGLFSAAKAGAAANAEAKAKAGAEMPDSRNAGAPGNRNSVAPNGWDAVAPRGQSAPKRGRIGRLLGLFSAAAAMAALVWFAASADGLSGLLRALAGIDGRWFAAALLAAALYWLLEAAVLQTLTLRASGAYRFANSARTGVVGLFYNAVTPFATGGQPMQLYAMSKSGLDVGVAGSILLTKSIIYQTCLTAMAVASVALGSGFFAARVPYFFALVAAGLALNLLAVAAMHALSASGRLSGAVSRFAVSILGKTRLVRRPEKTLAAIQGQLGLFHECSDRFGKSLPATLLAYALTIAQFLAYFSVPFCIYRSFGLSGAPILLMLCAQSIIMMITAFIPSPGASGAAEGSFYVFFSLFFSAASLMPAMLVWRFLTYYLNIIAGGTACALGMAKNGAAAELETAAKKAA
ncbi:MAG: flippase-like domain-containing protein [Clostridiales bacterium]|jgi:uncharacterized protein (TIRG00374 family)|nr:flippase-like domain-containing protein [Clostridiales bacterium]